ncbi:MAG: alpha/beta hydrolase [Pseudomonadota bacterium]
MNIENRTVLTADGLRLAVTRLPGGARAPVICIPGLTRNAADFEAAALKISREGRDVFAISLRGRGASNYDRHYLNYQPLVYRDDIIAALDQLEIARAIFIGTSLGGIVSMLVNEAAPDRVSGVVLNDIAPDLAPQGLARISGYVGAAAAAGPAASLEEATDRVRAINEIVFPDLSDADWTAFARRTFRPLPDGRWALDHDPNIARALAELGPAPNLWPAFDALGDTPTLIVRGETSDLLTPAIVERMRARHQGFDYVETPGVGHAPMLTESAAWGALKAFLDRLD